MLGNYRYEVMGDGNDYLGVAPSAGSMTTQYHTVQGIMVGETVAGTRSESLVDILGSVTNLSTAVGGIGTARRWIELIVTGCLP